MYFSVAHACMYADEERERTCKRRCLACVLPWWLIFGAAAVLDSRSNGSSSVQFDCPGVFAHAALRLNQKRAGGL